MLTKKQIGKIQLTLGIFLFIATIISSVLIIKYIYLGSLVRSVSGVTGTLIEASKELNATSTGIIKGLITPEVVSFMTIISLVVITTMFIFGICALILLTLSIILILQGLSNLAIK